MSAPWVSIVLPTRNGAATLPALLDALSRQRVDFPFETVVVDSASTDGTSDLLRGRVDRFIGVAEETFDHGLTRNVGIEHARGELVVLLVQDALPASDAWLSALTAPFVVDEGLAGVFARQRPRSDASLVTRFSLERSPASCAIPRTVAVADRASFGTLAPRVQLECCTFDNVCSCIRRSVWSRHPFRATPIAEDVEWAREVLLAGYTLAYVPEAEVIHSHDRPARYEFVRTYILHRRLYDLFKLRTIPSLPHLARAIASSLAAHRGCERRAGGSLVPSRRALALAFAWPLGQYLGALSGVRGWKWNRSKMV